MKTKLFCGVAALFAAGVSQAAWADDAPAAPTPEITVTGAAAIVSSYKFRGISQTNNKAAIQGTFTITDKSGFYVSAWGSPNEFSGGTEIDVYGGYSKTIAGFTLDGGGYGYIYPNFSDDSLYEIYGDVSKSYGPLGFKVGVNWAPKQHYFSFVNAVQAAGEASPVHNYSIYEYAEMTFTPPSLSALTVHGHVGHTGGGLDWVGSDGAPHEYMDYTAGVGYKWKALTFDVSGSGTNLSTFKSGGTRQLTKSVVVVSLTASF